MSKSALTDALLAGGIPALAISTDAGKNLLANVPTIQGFPPLLVAGGIGHLLKPKTKWVKLGVTGALIIGGFQWVIQQQRQSPPASTGTLDATGDDTGAIDDTDTAFWNKLADDGEVVAVAEIEVD